MKLRHLEHELSWDTKCSCLYVVKNGKRTRIKTKSRNQHCSIIDGNEEINGVIYDIKKIPEFSGVFIQPIIDWILRYVMSDYVTLSGV
jgi:hypothetical protein